MAGLFFFRPYGILYTLLETLFRFYMKKIFFLGCAMASVLTFSACSDSGSNANDDDPKSSSSVVLSGQAADIVKAMGVGINVGNVFEAPDEGSWGETFSDEGVAALADSGFKNIRIPVRWDTHLTDSSETGCTVDPVWMERITHAVDVVLKNGMIAVVNSHHWAGMYANPAGTKACYLDVYRQMTENFKDYSVDSLVIAVLNEPREKLSGLTWENLVAETIDLIRSITPDRTIIVGGGSWNSYSGLVSMNLPDSVDNLIAEFHYYEPMTVTHQGTDFDNDGEDDYPSDVVWNATGAEQLTIKKVFKTVREWSDKNLIPVYLGEFGVYSAADSLTRKLWTEFVRTSATSNGFACAYWEFSSGFGVYDDANDTWASYLMDALIRPTTDFSLYSNYPNLESTSYVLFDDFDSYKDENINLNTLSGRIAKSVFGSLDSAKGYWYVYHDSLSRAFDYEGNMIVSSTLIQYEDLDTSEYHTTFDKLIVKNGYDDRGLYVKFNLKGDAYPWLGFGANINSGEYDFTDLVALTFRAKGRGQFMVSWGMAYTDTCCGGANWGKFQTSIDLSEEWEEYTVWFDEWVPTPYSDLESEGAKWAEHNKAITFLQFANGQGYGEVVDDTLEIYLDDIRFYGMKDSNFGITK